MLKAIVEKQFAGRRDHQGFTEQIPVGDEIEGDLALVAIAQGWAKEIAGSGTESAEDVPDDLKDLKKDELIAVAESEVVDISDAKTKPKMIAAIVAKRNSAE